MYKATSEGLQRSALVGAQRPARKTIDPEMLRHADALQAEYEELGDRKRQITASLTIINAKIEQYKYTALRARYPVDNSHYRSMVGERRRLVEAVSQVDSEIVRVKALLKQQTKTIRRQEDVIFAKLFQQSAKLILAEELYLKVVELADTLEKTMQANAQADP